MNKNNNSICFMLGDKLPTVYDVAIDIFSLCSKPGSEKMKKCINIYATSLIDQWTKAFGEGFTLASSNVHKRITDIVLNYYSRVYTEQFRTKSKKKGVPFVKKSMRQLNKDWKQSSMTVTKHRIKTVIPNDSLLDIGVNMDTLTGDELIFYKDQLSERVTRISVDVDLKYVAEKELDFACQQATLEREECERAYIMEIDEEQCSSQDEVDLINLDTSINRSGYARQTKATNDFAVQCDYSGTRPSIRGVRNFTNVIKNTLCEVSVKCNLSNEAARLVFKTVCSSFYGHEYYLSKEEAIQNDPALVEFKSSNEATHPPHKISRTTSLSAAESAKLIPHSMEEWKVYEYVLPSSRIQVDYKQGKAIQQETEAAMALFLKPDGVKSTLHYDTTSRSQIDGDWPALILIFSDKRRFSLRPLFFAYEDRENIIRLFVETYKRLASATPVSDNISAKCLWQKTDSIMTDSVSKNLSIEKEVTVLLGSSRPPPNHLLCKSHPVEAFDRSNLSVLAAIENNLEFRMKLESINPAVKPFLRGKTTVVECAITSNLKSGEP